MIANTGDYVKLPKILLIDDNMQFALNAMLSFMDEGYKIDVCYSFGSAFQLDLDKYDYILVDGMTNEPIDGIDFVKVMKSKGYKGILIPMSTDDIINEMMVMEGADFGNYGKFHLFDVIQSIKDIYDNYDK